MPSIRLIEAHWNEINRGFFYAPFEYFISSELSHVLPKNTTLPFKNDIFCCCIQRRKKINNEIIRKHENLPVI